MYGHLSGPWLRVCRGCEFFNVAGRDRHVMRALCSPQYALWCKPSFVFHELMASYE